MIRRIANRKAIVRIDPTTRAIEQAHFLEPATPILAKRAASQLKITSNALPPFAGRLLQPPSAPSPIIDNKVSTARLEAVIIAGQHSEHGKEATVDPITEVVSRTHPNHAGWR